MFCGLPMMVAAEPRLLAAARPSRNGSGFMPRLSNATQTTGVKARHTISLASSAESTALATISASRKRRGLVHPPDQVQRGVV
jgi:hypothetical protein